MKCEKCGEIIQDNNIYKFRDKTLCENCCIYIRSPRVRKTHWQYLDSIKTGYLIPVNHL